MNESLDNAKKNKADEFYTQLYDIEAELRYYKNHIKNKIIFCNCDDPYVLNNQEKYLNIRIFTPSQIRSVYKKKVHVVNVGSTLT
jgi:hypothetical protein